MPANRSRTTEWRRCLKQVYERRGAIEIAVARDYAEHEDGQHLLWRVRLIHLDDGELVIEQPSTLGRAVDLEPGILLVAILAIGQNRWMFNTTILGAVDFEASGRPSIRALRLSMPGEVQRCQRRHYYRVSIASLTMPQADVWPLLDPKSVLIAERSNELSFEAALAAEVDGERSPVVEDEHELTLLSDDLMPDVGPKLTAAVLNFGGGGMGLRFGPGDAQVLARHKLYWMRFQLQPEQPVAICATCKLVHAHIDSGQYTYAGMSFDFSFNPGHQRFLVDQILRYIAVQQRAQFQAELDKPAA